MRAQDWRAATTGILVFFFVLLAAREITRPFNGLHSWDQAKDAWSARAHLDYGLGYTKGLTTLAVGNPPPAVPPWYLDHPQLPPLLDAGTMEIFGQNEASLRLVSLLVVAASLPFLLALLRRLYDEETAVLAAFLYIVFPITPYFNYSGSAWIFPFILLAYWCYLTLIGKLRDAPSPGKRHYLGLGFSLFVLPQLFWSGLFYAVAIGSDYLLRCWASRQRPKRSMLLILALAPAASAAAVFGVLLSARTDGWRGLLQLYLWRTKITGDPSRTRLGWILNAWEMIQKNYTLPVVLIAGAYLAYRVLARLRARRAGVESVETSARPSRAFAHPWIFVVPGLLVSVVFSESLWVHNHDYKWLSLPVALAAALGILTMRDRLLARGRAAANAATFAVIAVICAFAARGLNDYYAVRHRAPMEAAIFKRLNREMAPDETLLTYQEYLIWVNPNKIVHLRPEVAWYLNRNMSVATTLEAVERSASTGKHPFYLVSLEFAPPAFVEQLKARYPWEVVQTGWARDASSFVGEGDQLLFDLRGDQALMAKGLAALYQLNDPSGAAMYFRKVLARNPEHYGANFQLARTLDLLGAYEEAERCWKKTLELARRYADAETAGIALKRLDPRNPGSYK